MRALCGKTPIPPSLSLSFFASEKVSAHIQSSTHKQLQFGFCRRSSNELFFSDFRRLRIRKSYCVSVMDGVWALAFSLGIFCNDSTALGQLPFV